MTRIIGLAGQAGAGKDTAAEGLKYWNRFAFADPLKIMLRVLMCVRGADWSAATKSLWRQKDEPSPYLSGRTPRQALQWLGTEWGRNLMGDYFWLDTLADQIARLDDVVVTDVRFPNESKWIHGRGGIVVLITRPGVATVHTHVSEQQFDLLEPDHVIVNDGSIEDLHRKIQEIAGL